MNNAPPEPLNEPGKPPEDDRRAFAIVAAGMAATLAAAFGFGLLLDTPMLDRLSLSIGDAFIGVIATAPLIFMLFWFMQAKGPALVRFRESQIDFFADIGFHFTPARIAFLAIGAGITEELLFRGVFQSWMEGFLPLAIAIVAPNILFGVLHARTMLYALIAGAVGIYLGVLFAVTGNVITPMITHALYDAVALIWTRQAISSRRRKGAPTTPDALL